MSAHFLRASFLILAILIVPACAAADAVTEWNEKALAAATQAKQLPFVSTRTMALVHTAIFDAVNSIEGRCRPYKFKVSAPAGSSSEASVVAAAHAVLLNLFPEQKADLDTAYAASLARIPDGSGKTAGIAVGEEAAVKILALRASDGADAPNTYKPATTPGAYISTPLPIGSQWGNVTPWIMERGSQFRPAPPPALTGPVWARDYNEIKDLGAKKAPCAPPNRLTLLASGSSQVLPVGNRSSVTWPSHPGAV